jgi:release factor glutamine methyltransferase
VTEPAVVAATKQRRAGAELLPSASVLERASARLAEAGMPEPRREAVRIWRELTGVTEPELLTAVERRAGGEPLAYVTGRAGFRHLLLRADRRALIPRPETEQLVELVLAAAPGGSVADVGTGTGCIALSLAIEGRYHQVLATDRSLEALALAAVNRNDVGAEQVRLVQGHLTCPFGAGSLDALVSNPPYLTDAEWAGLDPSVAAWEPSEALVAGVDGLRETEELLADGRRVLRPGGWLALELDCRRAGRVAEMAAAGGWRQVQVIKDLFARERFLLARRSDEP